jgi:pimeloyl-ACP methyl ester carboxylesterase
METVVLVHGLWMNGMEMSLLRRRLRAYGYRVEQFRYRTVGEDLEGNARRLNTFLQPFAASGRLHLVAHSLGGLVVRRLMHDFPQQPPGRVVTLGTPHRGSYIARRACRSGLLRRLLGMSLPALLGEVPPWGGERELGSLAGSLSIGVGWLFRGVPRPNDGTVAVAETQLPGQNDHRVLPTSHFGLLFSRYAALQVAHFLRHGRFVHP